MKKAFLGFSIGIFLVCIIVIVILATGFWKRFFYSKTQEQFRAKVVTPEGSGAFRDSGLAGQTAREESLTVKAAMEDGEIIIAVLNQERDGNPDDEQIAAYRRPDEVDGPVYITCIRYDEKSGKYRRVWDAPTAATRGDTLSLFSQDIIGDRNNCILVTGMNSRDEHTMTIFRRNLQSTAFFSKIAELQIEGSLMIQETGRSLAYQQGMTKGQSFDIVAYGHDNSSNNILDRLEITYVFNPASGQYERGRVTRIPGYQIEQRQLRELLSGVPGVFENFINDLWYYVSPQGTLDSRQYLYFDPEGKEVIFFGDENQQVFNWLNSTRTRYGLNISSQNISISTLRRFIYIELESLDSIRLRVSEDVRLKITVNESWDGSYRRAGTMSRAEKTPAIKPAIDAVYDSVLGKLQFHESNEYSLTSGGTVKKGHYVFFKIDNYDLLELRPDVPDSSMESRMVYRIEAAGSGMSLSRVRMGVGGIHDLLEGHITLTPADNR